MKNNILIKKKKSVGPQNKSILSAHQGSMSTVEACRNKQKQPRIHIWRKMEMEKAIEKGTERGRLNSFSPFFYWTRS